MERGKGGEVKTNKEGKGEKGKKEVEGGIWKFSRVSK